MPGCDGHAFTLIEELVTPPIQKSFPLPDLSNDLLPSDHTLVAEDAGNVAGFASMRFESWNKRSILRHLYVAPEYRRFLTGLASKQKYALSQNPIAKQRAEIYAEVGFEEEGSSKVEASKE